MRTPLVAVIQFHLPSLFCCCHPERGLQSESRDLLWYRPYGTQVLYSRPRRRHKCPPLWDSGPRSACDRERRRPALGRRSRRTPITHTNRPPLSVPHCETHTCATAALNPSFRLTRFSTPPAMTRDCGTLPSAGKANSSPEYRMVLAEKSTSISSPGIIVFSLRATPSANFVCNRLTISGVSMHRNPLLNALRR